MESSLIVTIKIDKKEYMHGEPGHMYVMAPTGSLKAKLIASNKGKESTKLPFTTSQRYDFVIRDSEGNEVIRWSKDKAFMEVIGEEIIEAGDKLTYIETLLLGEIANPLPIGEYTIEGVITADISTMLSNSTDFKIIPTPFNASKIGFIYKKLHAYGSKSEGPDYFLQTEEDFDYILIYDKKRQLWEPDPYLDKYACVWNKVKHFKVIGQIEPTEPPKMYVKEIIEFT